MTDLALLLDDDLGVSGNSRGKIGRQPDGLIKGVGVKRLGAAEYCGHCFQGRPDDIVVGVLLGEAPARCLAMGP